MSDVLQGVQALASGLGAVLAGFTQTNRLLRLETPLGTDVLLAERLDGIETVGETRDADGNEVSGFRLEITALSNDAHLSAQQLLGHPVHLALLTDQGMAHYRSFHGHVTAFERLGSNGGFARYRLVVEPWLAFLKLRRDSYVFQNQSVIEIIDAVLGRYAGQGALSPVWRWALADTAVYLPRSLCIQHTESDHDFVQRLLAEEGLFAWFEHSPDSHTWVIADRNDAFGSAAAGSTDDTVGSIRYQRAAAMEAADTIQRFGSRAALGTQTVTLSSWDYASLDTRSVSQGVALSGSAPSLTIADSPGAYRYPDRNEGNRRAQRRAEGLAAVRHGIDAGGTVRRLAPGSVFTLADHPRYASLDPQDERGRFAVLRVIHNARNNLPADFSSALDQLFSDSAQGNTQKAGVSNDDSPLYQNSLVVHPLTQAYAPLSPEDAALVAAPALITRLRPRVHGSQTATVVGLPGSPVHTDRDHRIKVQFHFARGAAASSRSPHPSGSDNAPGSDAAGTWVRVANDLAGSNWGSHFVPRLGQEVLVGFLDGDIDRPVVTGALYNGVGNDDAPGNQAQQTAPAHTGNAPAWFAGNAHGPVLSGIKTQALASSQTGQGGYNHLLFDDTPGQSRTQLASTQHGSSLTLGHHRAHDLGGDGLAGNARLIDKGGLGFGASLITNAYGAVRGGAGVLVSADARRNGTFAGAAQMDAAEAILQLSAAEQITQSLVDTAKSQKAEAPDASTKAGAVPPVVNALQSTQKDLQLSSDTLTWASPHLVLSAPGGLTQLTPAVSSTVAGTQFVVSAATGIELLAQGAARYHASNGIALFTYGSSPSAQSPVTMQGLQLHAGAGQVSLQAQSDEASLAAKDNIRIASTTDQISVQASKHVLMTVAGAYLKIEGDTVQLHAPGVVKLMAGKKSFTGPTSVTLDLPELPKAKGDFAQSFALYALEGLPLDGAKITLFDPDQRKVIWEGAFDASGKTTLDVKPKTQNYMALAGFDAWSSGFQDMDGEEGGGDEGAADDSEEDGREEESKTQGAPDV